MNDYSARWPLWWAEGGMLDRTTLPLTDDLVHDLEAWARHFDQHYDWPGGWASEGARRAHADQAADVLGRLRAELDGLLEVTPDFWELTS